MDCMGCGANPKIMLMSKRLAWAQSWFWTTPHLLNRSGCTAERREHMDDEGNQLLNANFNGER